MNENTGLVIGVAVIGVAAYFILSNTKAGKAAGDIAKDAAKVVTDAVNLPGNIVTLVGDVPKVISTIQTNHDITAFYGSTDASVDSMVQKQWDYAIQTKGKNLINIKGVVSPSLRTMNMIYQVSLRYPEATASNWGAVAGSHGAKFDDKGNIISDSGTGLMADPTLYHEIAGSSESYY